MKNCKAWCLCIGLCLSYVFYACSNEENVTDKNNQESSYDRIGRLHNECLDVVLEKIISGSSQTKNGGRVIPDMKQIQGICFEFAMAKGEVTATRSSGLECRDPFDWSDFPKERKEYLIQLEKIVRKSSPSQLENLINQIHNLESCLKEDEEISLTEQDLLLHVMAVCRYSATYWAENFEKWQYELYGVHISKIHTRGETILSKEEWDKWGSIILADGAGGIYNGQYVLEHSAFTSVSCIR